MQRPRLGEPTYSSLYMYQSTRQKRASAFGRYLVSRILNLRIFFRFQTTTNEPKSKCNLRNARPGIRRPWFVKTFFRTKQIAGMCHGNIVSTGIVLTLTDFPSWLMLCSYWEFLLEILICPIRRDYLWLDRCLGFEPTVCRLIKAFADRDISLWLKEDTHLNMVLKWVTFRLSCK